MIDEIMKQLSELPKVTYLDGQEYIQLYDAMETVNGSLKQMIQEVIDRCKEEFIKTFDECVEKRITELNANIPYLMHKEMDIPLSECQKAYDVAIDYLRSQGKLRG